MPAPPRVFASLLLVMSSAVVSGQSRAPVLVELFTSEGCSSCPPADRLLQKLDSQVVVLSEHVDYWDQLGWKDQFSSPAFTARQRDYSRMLNLPDVYTPQMIVDGETAFVGSDSGKAVEAIAKAGRRKKADLRIARAEAGLSIDATGLPATAELMLALAEDTAASNVAAGENKGQRLAHVAVLRSLQKIGKVKHGEDFRRTVELPKTAAAQRIIVFLQESGYGRVSAVAMLPPALNQTPR